MLGMAPATSKGWNMMDIEKLIERLKYYGTTYAIGDNLGKEIDGSDELMLNAATALSTLKAENEKLRAELESKEKYYEQMIDALSAADSADLAQMTACVYYKPGGLCRYGGMTRPMSVCWGRVPMREQRRKSWPTSPA